MNVQPPKSYSELRCEGGIWFVAAFQTLCCWWLTVSVITWWLCHSMRPTEITAWATLIKCKCASELTRSCVSAHTPAYVECFFFFSVSMARPFHSRSFWHFDPAVSYLVKMRRHALRSSNNFDWKTHFNQCCPSVYIVFGTQTVKTCCSLLSVMPPKPNIPHRIQKAPLTN